MLIEEFDALRKQGFNRIPVYRRVLADIDTPVSAYLKVAQGPYSYLLESYQGGEQWGRYSIVGLPCRTVLSAKGELVEISHDGKVIETTQVADPLAFVSEFQRRYKVAEPEGLPSFLGGLVGYFAYDSVRYVESRLQNSCPQDELQTPDILLMVSEEVLVFDNTQGALYLLVLADAEQEDAFLQAQQRLDAIQAQLESRNTPDFAKLAMSDQPQALPESEFEQGFLQVDFERSVEQIKEYILSGDAMQVVIAQRMKVAFKHQAFNLYRALRSMNPSPYMYFLNFGDHQVVGSSPEILARLEDDTVSVRPIAGTRRRGVDAAEDKALEAELLADPKEIAEHLMLIDLGRNDAGRVSQVGTVRLTDKMAIERYSHVMHIVSNVEGHLKPGLNAMDVLKATLPAGTLSGAPKVRAMEIIDELEPSKRGVYGGAVGYLSWNGNMDTAIAIRTAVIKDETLYVQAGAGVVADSIPRLEWKETMNKARAVMRAAAMVVAAENKL